MEEGTPPQGKQGDDPISEARQRVRQMQVDVEKNKSLITRTRALIQRLSDLLLGNPKS